VYSVLFFSRPRSERWPHHGRTFTIYFCPLSFWLTLSRRVLSTYWCCPSMPCVVFLACVHNASVCGIHINGKPIHWVNKIKYLGVYLLCNTGLTNITDPVRKFYEKFNNIMAVLSKHSNEMSTLHLVKSCCFSTAVWLWSLAPERYAENLSRIEQLFQTFFFHAAGEKALNHYSIFAIHCQYNTIVTPAQITVSGKCIALILLFYSHYLVA